MKKANQHIILWFTGCTLLLVISSGQGCSKEYSFESGATPPPADTIHPPPPPPEFPVCPACSSNNGTAQGTWTFKSGNAVFCGTADTAIINLERTAFTFFGPSSCSRDSGMVITVYLDRDTLNRDKSNVIIPRNAFYYYDRIAPSYIFMSQSISTFSVTITNYDHAARIVSGTFTGNVIRANGNGAGIEAGKFKVKII